MTVRNWRRVHRWWLLGVFLLAVGFSFVVPITGGLALAGAGEGLPDDGAGRGRRRARRGTAPSLNGFRTVPNVFKAVPNRQ